MNAKHTPGPLSAWIEKKGLSLIACWVQTAALDRTAVMVAGGAVTVEQAEANARLYAAAPDLLAVCRMVIEQLEPCETTRERLLVEAAEAAIARAEDGAA